jgi:deoxyribose-phosphate aldolase
MDRYLEIAKLIDHSLLASNLTQDELEAGLELAVAFQCASVCIMPHYLARAADRLKGTGVFASTTIGFPHGGHTTTVKVVESENALAHGAEELDMVVNISRVKSGDWRYVAEEIGQLNALTHLHGARLKVIFENAFLSNAEKLALCQICGDAGVDWVKTSTGYGPGGATLADVRLMREQTPESVQVKAAGGIRDLETLLEYKALGVTRVGASRTSEMLNAWRERLGLEPIEAKPTVAGY